MELDLKYGTGIAKVTLNDDSIVDHFAPVKVLEPFQLRTFVESYQSSGMEGLIGSGKLLIVVNDGHRSTPTETVLDFLNTSFPDLLERSSFLVATGTHEKPTDAHLKQVFGKHLASISERLSYHDASDQSTLTRIGKDKFGEVVFINDAILRADRVLVIGSVEPHYFAGYTGGRKAFFPGLTDFATIVRNHNLANSLDARPLRIKGNPVAEHLDQMLDLLDLDKIRTIQVVIDSAGDISNLFIGDIRSAFSEAVSTARTLYAKEVAQAYDVVICEIEEPLDQSLYQIQKAVENTQMAVRDSGANIVLAPCQDGVGSKHFFDSASSWDREKNCPSDGNFQFGSHKLARVNLMSRRIDCLIKSELPDETVRTVFYEPVHDIDETISKKTKNKNNSPGRVAVVHDAAHTVLNIV